MMTEGEREDCAANRVHFMEYDDDIKEWYAVCGEVSKQMALTEDWECVTCQNCELEKPNRDI